MKISFADKSFVECKKNEHGKVVLIISAKDQNNSLKKITNAVELTVEEFNSLIKDI